MQDRGLEGPKSRSGGLLDGLWSSWAQFEPSRGHLGPSWKRLWLVLGLSWGASWGARSRLPGVLGARRSSLGHLKDSLEASEAILGRLGASDEGKMKHSILHDVFLIDFDWI